METLTKILVPIDFSNYSKNALRYAVSFAKHFNSKIYLVYIVEPVIYPSDFSMGQVTFPVTDLELSDRAKDELQSLANVEIGEIIPFYECRPISKMKKWTIIAPVIASESK